MAATKVRLEYRIDELKVEVYSEGPVSTTQNGRSGRGLEGMRQRVEAIGGRIETGPGIERGFQVRAWLPVAVAEP